MRFRIEEILKEKGKTKYWLYIQLGLSYNNFNRLVTNQTKAIKLDNLRALCEEHFSRTNRIALTSADIKHISFDVLPEVSLAAIFKIHSSPSLNMILYVTLHIPSVSSLIPAAVLSGNAFFIISFMVLSDCLFFVIISEIL